MLGRPRRTRATILGRPSVEPEGLLRHRHGVGLHDTRWGRRLYALLTALATASAACRSRSSSVCKVSERDDAPRPVPEDPPDRGHVHAGGGEEGAGGMPKPVPSAPGDAGPVAEAVEGLRERGVRLGEPRADGPGPAAVALQGRAQRRGDREAQGPPGLVPGPRDEADGEVDLHPGERPEVAAGEAGESASATGTSR